MTNRSEPSPLHFWRHLPPGLMFDVPVGVLLAACWLVVGVPWAHILIGVALTGLIAAHLATRRSSLRRLTRPPRTRTVRAVARRLGFILLLILAAWMVISGLLRWIGVPPRDAMHAIAGYSLLTVVAVHVWIVRRPLRVRLRNERPT